MYFIIINWVAPLCCATLGGRQAGDGCGREGEWDSTAEECVLSGTSFYGWRDGYKYA